MGASSATNDQLSASDYGVDGFDSDLLDAKSLRGALGKLARDTMVAALQRGLVAVRVNAMHALQLHGKLTTAETMSVAVMLKDESPSVRAAAARALACAADPSDVVGALSAASADRDETVRHDVGESVFSLGDAILPDLVRALACDAADADNRVLPHIVRHGDAAQQPLFAGLTATDERVRANSLAGLAMLGPAVLLQHQGAIGALFDDPSDNVRDMARQAMNAIYRATRNSHQPPAVPPAAHFTSQPISEAEAKQLKSTAIEHLHIYARDGRAVARLNAWMCLRARGGFDDYTTALGLVAQKDGDPRVRAMACLALTGHHADRLVEVIAGEVRCTLDREMAVRDAAWQALDEMQKISLPALIELIGERDRDVADQVVEALARHGAGAGNALLKTLGHVGPVHRWNAVVVLTRVGGKTLDGAFEALVDMLKDPFDDTRAAVVTALGKLPARVKANRAAHETIETMLDYDASMAVRLAADIALRAIAGA